MDWNPLEDNEGIFVSVDGELQPANKASVSVFDRGFLYGDAVFDSMPVYDSKVILLDRHVNRLYSSASGIQLSLALTKSDLKAEMLRAAKRSGLEHGALRIMVSRGEGPPGIVNADQTSTPTVVIVPIPSSAKDVAYGQHRPATGKARIVSTRAIDPDSLDSKIKSNNYLVNALAERELAGTNAEFGIMLNHDGFVAEEFVSNVFVRNKSGLIRTPPPTHALNGITRQLVMEIGLEEGYDIVEDQLTPADLFAAEDVFLTASARGIVSVSAINGQKVANGEPSKAIVKLARTVLNHARTEETTPIT